MPSRKKDLLEVPAECVLCEQSIEWHKFLVEYERWPLCRLKSLAFHYEEKLAIMEVDIWGKFVSTIVAYVALLVAIAAIKIEAISVGQWIFFAVALPAAIILSVVYAAKLYKFEDNHRKLHLHIAYIQQLIKIKEDVVSHRKR